MGVHILEMTEDSNKNISFKIGVTRHFKLKENNL